MIKNQYNCIYKIFKFYFNISKDKFKNFIEVCSLIINYCITLKKLVISSKIDDQ